MRHIALTLTIVLLLPSIATASPLEDLVVNPTYWRSVIWTEVERSKIWLLDGWEPYSGAQGTALVFKKQHSVTIGGKEAEALLVQDATRIGRQFLLIGAEKLTADDCFGIDKWLASQLGTPQITVDSVGKLDVAPPESWTEFIDKRSQWELGTTRATLRCYGVKSVDMNPTDNSEAFIADLTFGDAATEVKIKPLFGLRCTRQMVVQGQLGRAFTDVSYIVDENSKTITHGDRSVFASKEHVDDYAIEFTHSKSENFVSRTRIDRQSGAIRTEIRRKSGEIAGEVVGRCEKTAPGERKF